MTITIPASPSSYTLSASGTTASNAGTRGQSGGGPSVGIYLQGSNDILVNSGTILGGSAGSNLDLYGGVGVKNGTGDSVTNLASGLIENTYSIGAGIVFYLTPGTITNAGRLIGGVGSVGHSGNGVDLFAGGSVTNLGPGTISGGGVFAGTRGIAGTVTNSGEILGSSVYGGIYLAAGGAVTNLAGTIAANGGSYGIKIAGAAGTITNAATITSGSVGGTAILMASVAGNRVIDQTGGVFIGTVNGGSNATMELASSASAGVLTATSGQFTNFSALYIDSGAAWTIKGDSTLSSEFSKIGGFTIGDTISLTGLSQTPTTFSSSTAVNSGTTTTSVVIQAGSTGLETLTLLGSISASQLSFTAGTTSTLTETAAAPVITAGATVTFNGGGAAVVADSGLTVTDAGSSTLASATVSIGGFITGDTLTVGTLGGLTPAFSDGTLTLTGTASLATYETALDSVDYGFAADDDPTGGGSHTSRTLSWTVNDGTSASNTATSTVDTVHTAPTVTAGGSVTFVQGGSAVTLDPSLTVTDPDSGGVLNSATIAVSGGLFATDGDTLLADVTGTGLTATYTASDETLVLSGSGVSLSVYQTVLRSVELSSNGATAGTRTIDWTVNDGVDNSATATSSATVHDAPVITSGGTVTFNGGGAPVVADSGLTVTDASSTTAASATVVIGGFITGDTLTVGTLGGLTPSFNNGTLTLSGTASLATYRTALDSVEYGFAANDDPTGGGSHTSRTLSWSINDGTVVSNTGTSTVDTVHTAPTVVAGASPSYVAGGAAVALDPALTVSDPDSGGDLVGATVAISSGLLSGDSLNFTNQGGITGSFGSGTLTLSGTATLNQYQTALESITYSSGNPDPAEGNTDTSRTITWSVNDGVAGSTAVTSTVHVDTPPSVVSIDTVRTSPNSGGTEQFAVVFSESVTGVDTSDFTLADTGSVTGTINSISGSGSSYTVTVTGATGSGTMGLDLKSSGTGITDAAGNGPSGGFTSGETYTITPASGAPSISAPATATVGVNKAHAIGTVTIAESPITGGETFTLVLSDNNGVLAASTGAVGGGGSITPSNSGKTLTVFGTLAQVNADLTTLTDDDPTTPSDTISYSLSDSDGGIATPASTTVTVNSVPSISVPGPVTVDQSSATAVPGVSVAESGDTTTSGETFTVAVSDGAGVLSANTGASGGGGTITSSNGGMTQTIVGTLAQVNADLTTLADDDPSIAADTITVTATDSFGNSTVPSTTIPVTVTPAGPTTAIFDAHVYDDVNVNGVQDSGDINAAGITVNLLDGFGNPTGTSAITDSGGNVSFTGLAPGSYEVGVVTLAGDAVTQATNLNTPNTLTAGQTATATEGFYAPPALAEATLDLTVAEGQSLGNIWSELVGNGIDPNPASLTITAVGTTGTHGGVTLNAGTDSLVYVASGLNPSDPVDVFTYTLQDGSGGTVTGTVDVTVTGPNLPTTIDTTPGSNGSVSGSGQRLISQGAGQTLVGSSAGGDEIFGGSDTTVAAAGSGNTIFVTPGNHVIGMGVNNNAVTLYDGNNTVSASGTGNTVTGGNGNDTVTGMTGNATITLGNGTDIVTITGANNKVTVGTGADHISAGSGGNETVVAGDGANTIVVGGANNSITAGNGANKVTASGNGATITLGDGGNTVGATGTGDQIATGSGNDTIQTTAGTATIKAGLGINTIKFAGSGNTIVNQGGTDTLTDTGTNNTIGLPLAGQGLDTINGSVLANGDTFDLRAALAATTWDQQISDLGSYLSLGTSGPNTLVQLSVTSGGTPITIAVLNGQGAVSLSSFTSHALLT